LSIASHSGLAPAAIGALAGAAERAGFTAVFVAEGHGDALALCHPVAAATSRVRVGTAVANAALRPPVLAAKTAVQLDRASDGRFVLGLGVANPIMNGRFGIPPFPPGPPDAGGQGRAQPSVKNSLSASSPPWRRATSRRCGKSTPLTR
jgi:alkanesulfonate monooxygenase SsuD/methylene tetrahydromethanopterin reductase-like flavin-dependent oxidoreductase (luciferase family)